MALVSVSSAQLAASLPQSQMLFPMLMADDRMFLSIPSTLSSADVRFWNLMPLSMDFRLLLISELLSPTLVSSSPAPLAAACMLTRSVFAFASAACICV